MTAPAPTEDAPSGSAENPIRVPVADFVQQAITAHPAADTAAEEPRTEAQIKAEALREAAARWEKAVEKNTNALDLEVARRVVGWLRDRADRLSRAHEGGRES